MHIVIEYYPYYVYYQDFTHKNVWEMLLDWTY